MVKVNFSRRTFHPQSAESILEWGYHANATPFVWNEKRGGGWHVTLLRSWWRSIFVHSSQLITFFNIPFLAIGLGLNWTRYTENEMFVQLTLHSLWLAFYVGCISMQVLFALKAKDVCDVINEIYRFVSVMERHFKSPDFRKKRELIDWLVNGAAFYTVGGSLFGVGMFIYFHEESWYFLFPLQEDMKYTARMKIWPLFLFTIVEFWYEVTQWVSFTVLTYVNALYLLNVGAFLEQLMKRFPRTQDALRRSHLVRFRRLYSSVSLLQTSYNNCYGVFFWPIFLAANVICSTGTLSAFIITLDWGVPFVTLFIGSFMVVTVSIIAIANQFTSNVQFQSGKLITWIGCRPKCDEGRRIYRSIRICEVNVGSFYSIEKKTFLTLTGVILNTAATVLLSGKSVMT